MFLVLCNTGDRSAIWAAHQLRKRLAAPVPLVSPQMLFAGVWEHRVGDGSPRTRIRLPNKLTVESSDVSGVLNRVSFLPGHLFPRVSAADRTYATQECTALYMSWLESLRCPVLNPATAQGLCGAFRPADQWHVLAASAGLKFGAASANARGVVVGDRWIGPMPDSAPRFVQLARAAATPLLGIDLHLARNGWRVTNAHAMPEFLDLGAPMIDALQFALAGEA
jgi:hypothetical protein